MSHPAVETLNALIETCKDGEQGFRTAAEGARTMEVKRMFVGYAQERAQFAAELEREVRRLGGEPARTGSSAGALHRGWMNIKSAVTGHDDRAIVDEAERGEDSAKNEYEAALRRPLPADIKALVERQYARVREAHDRVRDLRQAA